MLCNIPEESVEAARRILTLLCFSSRPLTVPELIDGVAVNIEEPEGLDPRRRVEDVDDLREICPGLIEFNTVTRNEDELEDGDETEDENEADDEGETEDEAMDKNETENVIEVEDDNEAEDEGEVEVENEVEDEDEAMDENETEDVIEVKDKDEAEDVIEVEDEDAALRISQTKTVVRIAHYSVQEYLESDRNKQSKAAKFYLHHLSAHEGIAKIYLIYLKEPELSNEKMNWTKLKEFPLARLAARFWPHHYEKTTDTSSSIDDLALKMFRNREGSLLAWLKLCNVDEWVYYYNTIYYIVPNFNLISSDIASPLYYASLLGLDSIVRELLQVNAAQKQNLVNAKGGRKGNPLQAAIHYGHEKMVQTLLDAGANVNAQGGYFGNALQAASYNGHEKIVQILLNAGANVNAQGGYYDNALQAASVCENEKIVQILIDEGVDKKWWGDALLKASKDYNKDVVKFLINAGVDKSYYNDAMQLALKNGNKGVVKILATAGAAKKENRIPKEKEQPMIAMMQNN